MKRFTRIMMAKRIASGRYFDANCFHPSTPRIRIGQKMKRPLLGDTSSLGIVRGNCEKMNILASPP
jgi:hypothetical protein